MDVDRRNGRAAVSAIALAALVIGSRPFRCGPPIAGGRGRTPGVRGAYHYPHTASEPSGPMGRVPRGSRPLAVAIGLVGGLLVISGVVTAHPGIGSKFDAPVPLSLLLGGRFDLVGQADGTPVEAPNLARWSFTDEAWHAVGGGLDGDGQNAGKRLEHLARYVTRAPLRLDAMELLANGRVRVRTPVHPQTGATRMELDVLEMIRRLCAQIPDPRQHMVLYFGWYSHRTRGERRKATGEVPAAAVEVRVSTPRSRSWARLMRRIFEVDPLLCPQCQVEMKVVSVIQEVAVVDRLLRHLRKIGGNDPHEGTAQRGPPGGARASPDEDG